MDPLSVTSGIVGIVAFALQLAKTASKMKRAIEEVKSAPNVARELIEKLVMLETACQLIGFHLERRETLPGHHSSASPDIISNALAQCLSRIEDLEQLVSPSSPSNSVTGTPGPRFDTASRLRLVLRKDRIRSLVQDIDRVISLLQFVIQVDMWTMTSMPLQPTTLSKNGVQLMDGASESETTSTTTLVNSACSQSNVAQSFRRRTNQQCRTFQYLGCITWTITDGWTGDENDNVNHMTYRKGCITFPLPFTSTQLSMHYYDGMGTPSYALNVTHIIPNESKLGRRLWGLMRPGADPQALHELVSRRELSLYSIFQFGDQEYNLFFMAVAMRWAEGCRYILQHDFRHKIEEDETPSLRFSMRRLLSGKACEVTEMMLSVRPQDMREKDIKYLLDAASDPEYFSRYLNVFLKSSGIDHAEVLSFAWERVVLELSHSLGPYDDVSGWIPALRCLMEHRVDFHQQFFVPHDSAYTWLLRGSDHPFEADERAYHWLELLKVCGVDLHSYIEAEITLIVKNGISYCIPVRVRPRKMVILDFKGLPVPSWRWELVTESNIIEILEEFHNFGFDGMEYYVDCAEPSGPDDFKCWKAADKFGQNVCFPFSLSPMDSVKRVGDYWLRGLWRRETYNRAVELRDQRFARRQAKKWRKAHPEERPPSKTMPGTWVD